MKNRKNKVLVYLVVALFILIGGITIIMKISTNYQTNKISLSPSPSPSSSPSPACTPDSFGISVTALEATKSATSHENPHYPESKRFTYWVACDVFLGVGVGSDPCKIGELKMFNKNTRYNEYQPYPGLLGSSGPTSRISWPCGPIGASVKASVIAGATIPLYDDSADMYKRRLQSSTGINVGQSVKFDFKDCLGNAAYEAGFVRANLYLEAGGRYPDDIQCRNPEFLQMA